MSTIGKIVIGCNIASPLMCISIASSDWTITTATVVFCLCCASLGAIFGQLTIANLERRR